MPMGDKTRRCSMEGAMSIDTDFGPRKSRGSDGSRTGQKHRLTVALNDEQIAAVEGWRLAHGIDDQSEALGELVRLALLGEIAKIYRLVADRSPETARDRRSKDSHRDS